jgi:hypothetical protein
MHSHTIFEAERLILLEFSGTVDYLGLMEGLDGLTQDPDYSRDHDGICDLRKARLEMTPGEVRMAAVQIATEQRTVGKWAIMIDEPRGTALATLYVNAIAGQHSLRVFSTVPGVSEYVKRDLGPILPE